MPKRLQYWMMGPSSLDAGDDQAAPNIHDDADHAQEYGGEVPVGKFGFQRIDAVGRHGQGPAGGLYNPATGTKWDNLRNCGHV
jgi:hypothetical protein